MNGGDTGVAFEVAWVVRKNAVDAVDLHPSRKPSVVNLNSLYLVLDQELSPFRIDRGSIVQEGQNWIKAGQSALRLVGWKTEAVLVRWPGANVPKLGDIL